METRQRRRNEDERYLRAARKYAVSYMSNAKWRKLFATIDEAGIEIEKAVWRFIDGDEAFAWGWPDADELDEARLKDGRFQPVEYKWIEAIFVPREYQPDGYQHVPHAVRRQDVAGILSVLRRTSQYMVEEDADGITILGYGRRS